MAAIAKLAEIKGEDVVNLGTGRGYSVLEIVAAFGKACGREIPYVFGPRRAGQDESRMVAVCALGPGGHVPLHSSWLPHFNAALDEMMK